jgi:SET domain-containing protein
VSEVTVGLNVRVAMTATMGRGVFAAEAIARGAEVGRFHTIRIPPAEVRAMAGSTLSHFWFEDDADGAAFVVLGFIELVNHSVKPNADRTWHVTPEGEVVRLYALRDIAAGEQIFIDYRFDATSANPAWAAG